MNLICFHRNVCNDVPKMQVSRSVPMSHSDRTVTETEYIVCSRLRRLCQVSKYKSERRIASHEDGHVPFTAHSTQTSPKIISCVDIFLIISVTHRPIYKQSVTRLNYSSSRVVLSVINKDGETPSGRNSTSFISLSLHSRLLS